MKKRVLVTGGSGLIGTYLKEYMPEATYVNSRDFNLLIEADVMKMFREIRPNIVIHLAALVGGVHHNIEEPVRYFEENILMNTFVLKESYKNNGYMIKSFNHINITFTTIKTKTFSARINTFKRTLINKINSFLINIFI